MNRMIIMFPANPENNGPIMDFEEEYAAVHAMPFFDVVLFDLANTLENGKLYFLQNPADHRAPAMYRGPRISTKDYKVLFSAAEAADICMITDEWRYAYLHRFCFNNFHAVDEKHRDTPETRDVDQNASSSLAYSGMRRKLCRALPDSDTCKPCYFTVSNSEGSALVAKNLDADPRFIDVIEKLTNDCLDTLKAKHLNKSESLVYTNLILQEYVRLKEYSGATNEWRSRFFDGRLFELLPNSRQPEDAPKPPQWLIEKHANESPYYELDFAELYDEDWLILGSDDGQVAKRALGQSAKQFYESLEAIARDSPHLPEWIWCLVANIDDSTRYTKPNGAVIKGTKHFSPGTKIYIGSEWHGGWDDWTFVVIGKPRRQRHLIQIYMTHDKLCNFRLKKVYDKRVIERMTKFDRGMLRLSVSPNAHAGWDNTDESKEEIKKWIEMLQQAYRERNDSK